MSTKHTQPDGPSGSTSGRGPREDHAAEAPFGTAGGASRPRDPEPPRSASASRGASAATRGAGGVDAGEAFDSELVDDLGAEFALRGDVMEGALEAAQSEAADLRDRVARSQAEFDNYRKRTTREREEERKRAGERLVSELLPAIDNLERAIEHTATGGDLVHLLSGVEAVHAQVIGILGKAGVGVIDPFGEPFDPTTQQAVSQQEDEAVPEGTVVAVFQKGYEMGGRVMRPAMVVVSTGGPKREE